jgi:hypothetical protein
MSVMAIEGVVDHGLIRLATDTSLPDGTRVYVIVPDGVSAGPARVSSPHLARREDAADFTMKVAGP